MQETIDHMGSPLAQPLYDNDLTQLEEKTELQWHKYYM